MKLLLGFSIAFLVLAGGELGLVWLGHPSLVSAEVRTLALQAWLLEAVAFCVVARLLVGRTTFVLDGIVIGGVLWVVRWPVLALTISQLRTPPPFDWSVLVRDRLVLDLVLGILLALVFRRERPEAG